MQVLSTLIETKLIWPNTGQIAGLPQNPRFIKDERYEKLVKSIQDHPEMLSLRECLVVPYADQYVVIAGNMRLKATIDVIGLNDQEFADLVESKQPNEDFNQWFSAISELRESKSIPCKVLPQNTSLDFLKAIIIKDNVGFGDHDWDLLANEWDEKELEDWGMELPVWDKEPVEEEEKQKSSVVRLTIEFDDLGEYDAVKEEIKVLLDSYPGAKLRE